MSSSNLLNSTTISLRAIIQICPVPEEDFHSRVRGPTTSNLIPSEETEEEFVLCNTLLNIVPVSCAVRNSSLIHHILPSISNIIRSSYRLSRSFNEEAAAFNTARGSRPTTNTNTTTNTVHLPIVQRNNHSSSGRAIIIENKKHLIHSTSIASFLPSRLLVSTAGRFNSRIFLPTSSQTPTLVRGVEEVDGSSTKSRHRDSNCLVIILHSSDQQHRFITGRHFRHSCRDFQDKMPRAGPVIVPRQSQMISWGNLHRGSLKTLSMEEMDTILLRRLPQSPKLKHRSSRSK
jgi:hypothetical protein